MSGRGARSIPLPGPRPRDRRAAQGRIAAVVALPLVEVLALAAVAIRFPEGLPLIAVLAIALIGVSVAVIITWWRAVEGAGVEVSPVSGELRLGRRRLPFAELDEALQQTDSIDGELVVALRLGRQRGPHGVILLRHDDQPALDRRQQAALVDALARSSVRLPIDPHDPTGRFADSSFPDHLDRDAAIGLVERMSIPSGGGPPAARRRTG